MRLVHPPPHSQTDEHFLADPASRLEQEVNDEAGLIRSLPSSAFQSGSYPLAPPYTLY